MKTNSNDPHHHRLSVLAWKEHAGRVKQRLPQPPISTPQQLNMKTEVGFMKTSFVLPSLMVSLGLVTAISALSNSVKTKFAFTKVSMLALLGMLLALGGAPRAWGAYPSSATGTYTVNQVGNRVIYTFTGSGTFTPAVGLTADLLVVGGGGGGGGKTTTSSYYGGGGGAGGLVALTGVALTAQPYTVTVGAGGTAGTSSATGGNGGNSVFGTYTAIGGGGGGSGVSGSSTGAKGLGQ